MLSLLLQLFGGTRTPAPPPPRPLVQQPRRVHARYDAAVTTDENRRHWAAADGLSARSANSPSVRRTLRNRTRHECANSSYAKGIALTLSNDVAGTGPRLQMLTERAAVNRQIERAFAAWAEATYLAEKLRTLEMTRVVDGEGFALLTSNPRLSTPVQLDLRLIEADRVAAPFPFQPDTSVDGITFDAHGNPLLYTVLRDHPGDGAGSLAYDLVQAESMIHFFRADRPGQVRGVPDFTPALPLFAQLRRFTLAVISAAETVAEIGTGVIYTDAPADETGADATPYDRIDLERRMFTVLPDGWKLSQLHAEQPATTYAEFKHEILNEVARCFNMPFNIAAGNSSGYNFASGRLDHQTYFKSIRIEQSLVEALVLDRLLRAWLDEAVLVPGLLPAGLGPFADWPYCWIWDGNDHIDPLKEANAQAVRLANHTTTLAEEYAKRGQDWETQLRQRAKERALIAELGLALPQPASSNNDSPSPDSEEDDADDADQAQDAGNPADARAAA